MSVAAGDRILIIRLSAIGDVIVTTPLSRAVKEAFPSGRIGWVVDRRAADVLRENPYIDQLYIWDRRRGASGITSVGKLLREIRRDGWDVAIDCQGLLRSAVIARFSGARRVIGSTPAREGAAYVYTDRVPKSSSDLSSRQRVLDLLTPLGVKSSDRRLVSGVSDAHRDTARALLTASGLSPEAPIVCFVPATTWAQKHWFEENWSELAGLVTQQLDATPVLLGSPADEPMMERIRAGASVRVVNLAGKTTIPEAGAVLELAIGSVAVDTALMHLAAAVGTPTAVLCGASWWPGFADYERATIVREPMSCSPCLRHPTCDGRFDCMRALSASRVLQELRKLL